MSCILYRKEKDGSFSEVRGVNPTDVGNMLKQGFYAKPEEVRKEKPKPAKKDKKETK